MYYKRNEDKLKELKTETILSKILKYKTRCIEHADRMQRGRLSKLFKNYKTTWIKKQKSAFTETFGRLGPKLVNKWPDSVTDI
jgi:hypothetical protein